MSLILIFLFPEVSTLPALLSLSGIAEELSSASVTPSFVWLYYF